MKTNLLTQSIIAILATLIVCGTASASIAGSAHDFSTKGWNTTGEMCVVCHTPHNADNTVANAPLWNHDVTTATYTPYTSLTLDATVGQPAGTTKLCLSCHDGTIAVDSFGGATGTNFLTGGKNLSIDLSDDHPISFTYDATLASADAGLFDPTSVNSGLGGTIDADMLFGGKVECSSCHDVHNAFNNNDLLVKSNAGSALCLTCHNK
ncbi:MAG: cytochrome c3 family protein [Candidatus Hydrogenedentes bacterium]|nr:cytochrome c3 family protein [Candidatus Hydrogenedentota bacterium]